jgi:phosphodiester glycosidase
MPDGLTYRRARYRDSTVHVLEVDLTLRSIRPVLAANAFPFGRVYPIKAAIAFGALAAVGGGYNMQRFHHTGVTDQPLHALVVDHEIYTTGVGRGGQGFLIGKDRIRTQPNRIEVTVWSGGRPVRVEHVNRGHEGTVAFTPRGGTNEFPQPGRHYVSLAEAGDWTTKGELDRRAMVVVKVQDTPIHVWPNTIVLESDEPLGLEPDSEVTWVQRLGANHVIHVVSGATTILYNGLNIVPTLDLHSEASQGPDNWYILRGPRVVIGCSHDGRTAYFVTVEGRIPSSKGLRLKEMGTLLAKLGVWGVVNMDGGGSAWMWTQERELVADSCYGNGTLEGLRPDHYVMGVF